MPEVLQPPPKAVTRRDRFREYMKRFNPTASARDAIEAGLVVDGLHQSLYQKLAVRADLEPGSQQLIVGGVGSGKTTQLLLAVDWLRRQGNTIPLYVDVAAWTDLSRLDPGAVLAAFGVRMANEGLNRFTLTRDEHDALLKARDKLMEFPFEEDTPEGAGRPLYHPMPVLKRHFPWARGPFDDLFSVFRKASHAPVAVIDGLDRLLTAARFWTAVEADFAALRERGVSVLAAAPITVLFELGRSIPDQFDRVHHLPPLIAGPEGGVLRSVLERRGGTDILGPSEADKICSGSGGMLRDLISLARDAGEEAYVSGAERIGQKHAEKAVRQLGTAYLRGLGPEEIRALSQLDRTRSFDLRSDVNVQLLATRRILEYSATDFRVHPALLPLIPQAELRVA